MPVRGSLGIFRETFETKPLDFRFSCDTIWVRVEGHGHTHVYKLPELAGLTEDFLKGEQTVPTIYIVRHRQVNNLILGVYNTAAGAEEALVKPEDFEILEFEVPYSTDTFPVWIASVGKDEAYRIIGVFTDRKQAAKIASSVGGRLREYECLPQRRMPMSVYVYRCWVVLGVYNQSRRARHIDEVSVRRRLYQGEESTAFPIATFRRPYDSSLPNRIEVLARDDDESLEIAQSLARLTDEQIRGSLEYNVDYKVIKTEDGWEIDPCLLEQPA